MEMWMKIGSAVLLLAMLAVIFPRARQMLKESPKGSVSDWMGFLFPLGLVILFVLLLMSLV